MSEDVKKKLVICMPTLHKPHPATLESIKNSVPVLEAAGWEHGIVSEIGCPYVSAARATMLRKALDAKATVVLFLDCDLSWKPSDLLKVIETEGDVAAGTYRFKNSGGEETYMGTIMDGPGGRPIVRQSDGAVKAFCVPAGFLKLTRNAVNAFMKKHPQLIYGEPCHPHVDLFHIGAMHGVFYGEDFAFCRLWLEIDGAEIWIVPDIDLDHHSASKYAYSGEYSGEGEVFRGNFHRFLLRQPGGSESANPNPLALPPEARARIEEHLAKLPKAT